MIRGLFARGLGSGDGGIEGLFARGLFGADAGQGGGGSGLPGAVRLYRRRRAIVAIFYGLLLMAVA
jgi:hypothetical protein